MGAGGEMMYQLIKETFPVARKAHKCIWCGQSIVPGERYRHEISKYDEFQDHKWHQECNAAAVVQFTETLEVEFDAYDNDRPAKETS